MSEREHRLTKLAPRLLGAEEAADLLRIDRRRFLDRIERGGRPRPIYLPDLPIPLWDRFALQPWSRPTYPDLIYFAQAGNGPIKIGIASEPIKRLAALQTAHHELLTLRLLTEGTKDSETALHTRFAKHRIRGEWFNPHPELLAFIELWQSDGCE